MAKIDSYNNTTEVTQGNNRIVKTQFSLELQGYLISQNIQKEINKNSQKFFTKSTIVFNNEISVSPTGTPLTRDEIRNANN